MLFYVREAGRVRKSCVIKAIKTRFFLLQQREKLLIMAPTKAVASEIGGSTVHAAIGIKILRKKLTTFNANA